MIIQGPLITLDYLTTIIWDFFPNLIDFKKKIFLDQWTEVRFASFLSGRFTTMAVINPPESELAKHTSVQWHKMSEKNTHIYFFLLLIKK